jgi:hypothetical protein
MMSIDKSKFEIKHDALQREEPQQLMYTNLSFKYQFDKNSLPPHKCLQTKNSTCAVVAKWRNGSSAECTRLWRIIHIYPGRQTSFQLQGKREEDGK